MIQDYCLASTDKKINSKIISYKVDHPPWSSINYSHTSIYFSTHNVHRHTFSKITILWLWCKTTQKMAGFSRSASVWWACDALRTSRGLLRLCGEGWLATNHVVVTEETRGVTTEKEKINWSPIDGDAAVMPTGRTSLLLLLRLFQG